ncbi:MAG: hypothetical protein ACE5IE_05985 [Dehalococcoidia bacterium]
MVKKVVLLLSIVALFVGSLLAVGCVPGIVAIDLVPQEANLVARIQIGRILADPDLIAAYDEATKEPDMPQTFEQALDRVEDEIGIDPRDFSEAVIFADIESEDYFGAIISGTFDREALMESIEQAIGEEMTATEYRGYTIHTIAIEGEEWAIFFLSDGSFVFGSLDAVRDVIDVKEGEPGLSGAVAEAYTSLGDVWVKVAAEVPEEAIGELTEDATEIPMASQFLEDIEVVGFSFDKIGENLSLVLKMRFSSLGSPLAAVVGITTLKALMTNDPDAPPQIADIIDGLSTTTSGHWLIISLETTLAEVQNLLEAMEQGEL